MSARVAWNPRPMRSPRSRSLPLVAALGVTLLLGAACSSGDDDSTDTTGDGTTTTAQPVDDATLQALLPTDADLPAGYSLIFDGTAADAEADDDDDSDTDAGTDQAFDEACPGLSEMATDAMGGSDDEETGFVRSWEAEDDRAIEVRVRQARAVDVDVEALVAAINDCETIETDMDGLPATLDLQAEPLELGDDGYRTTLAVTIDFDIAVVQVESTTFAFRRNGVAVDVEVESGTDDDMAPVPADVDAAEQLAADLDARIQAG